MIVSGHLETIKRSVGESRKAQRAVDAIDQATKRGASLTRQLLAFARRQTLQPQQLDVPEQIAALKTLVEASIGSTISLTVETHPQLWTIHADPNELELALLNIVVNAKDAMPHGGRITISAQNKTLPDGDIKSISGEFVLITVSDTGHGMAPDIQNRAFEPFFSTKGPDRGTGLGLSQVYGFAHQSGGLATLHSAIGAGTTVSLYLPRGASDRLSKSEATKTGPAKSGLALVVDDNPDVAKATASLLEVLGYTVLIRNGGSAALEAFASHDVSLIVSDIVMAGEVNGLGLARKLRAERPELPILLITGYTDQLAEAEAEFPVLRKPFQLLDLDRALSRAMAEATDSDGGKIVRLRIAHPKPHSTN
jgi:CheY-like chemotaxis protein